jgi:hypothetical protein
MQQQSVLAIHVESIERSAQANCEALLLRVDPADLWLFASVVPTGDDDLMAKARRSEVALLGQR